jgi:hypothetical protein
MKCCEFGPLMLIYFMFMNSTRSVWTSLMNMPNKLECYTTLGWKDLPNTNDLAFLGAFMCSEGNGEYGPRCLADFTNV